jgi:hypothetical protein
VPRRYRTRASAHAGLAGFAPPSGGVRGVEQSITSAGVNWYPNPNLRFLLDFLHVNVDRLNPANANNSTPFGPVPATPPIGADIGQTFNAYALRSQYRF